MSIPPPARCRHGHLWTPRTSKWYVRAETGKRYRICTRCHADRARLKYRNDAEHREREKARTRQYYQGRCEPQPAFTDS
jgi:hypothetical protein